MGSISPKIDYTMRKLILTTVILEPFSSRTNRLGVTDRWRKCCTSKSNSTLTPLTGVIFCNEPNVFFCQEPFFKSQERSSRFAFQSLFHNDFFFISHMKSRVFNPTYCQRIESFDRGPGQLYRMTSKKKFDMWFRCYIQSNLFNRRFGSSEDKVFSKITHRYPIDCRILDVWNWFEFLILFFYKSMIWYKFINKNRILNLRSN